MHQGLGDQHTPLHAARELAHVGRGLVGQPQAGEQLVDPVVVAADAEVTRLDAQRLAHVEEGVEHQFLGHHAQLAARGLVVGLHVVAVHRDAALGGARQAGQDADERGLARPVRSEQAEKFTRFDVETDRTQGVEVATRGGVGLGDVLE